MLSLFPLHPRWVHFPIALLITGSLAALAYLVHWRRQTLSGFAWSSLFLGWLALFPAVLSGLIDQNQAPQTTEVTSVLNPHIATGFGLIVIYGLVLYQRLRTAGALDLESLRIRLFLLLLLGLSLIVLEGWLGGKLVYELGVGVGS